MIPITQELKKSVRTAYSAYKERLQREREEEEKRKEEGKKSLQGHKKREKSQWRRMSHKK